tara:strand:+ start:654 stop:1208 length:555 start_codon:yes stop_codon:yes gene_type:complete
MSTIKTTNITHGSNTGTNNLILDDTGKVSIAEKKLHCPGQIIQVVQAKKTDVATFSDSTWETSTLECAITPAYTTSDILVCYKVLIGSDGAYLRMSRLARKIGSGSWGEVTNAFANVFAGSSQTTNHVNPIALDWMDDPSFSAGETVTYRVEINSGNGTMYINRWDASDTVRGASTITLYEIAK